MLVGELLEGRVLLYRWTEHVGRQRAQVTSKSYTRRGRCEGAARWFEAGTGAKVGRCWFGAGGLMGLEQGENESGAATDMCRQAHGCLAEDRTRCQEE